MSKTTTPELTRVEIYPATTEDLCQSLSIERYLPQADRDKISSEDFAGPDRSFPIDTQSHLDAAAHLIGHAADPAAVKAKAIRIAKRKGFTLPKSWQDGDGDDKKDDDSDRNTTSPDETRAGDPGLIIGPDGSHDKFTGIHIHKHSAFDSQSGEKMHEHEHEHRGDSNHHHTHLDGDWQSKGVEDKAEKVDAPDILRNLPSETSIYLPITRIDKARREVILRATAEAFDSYGTVIGFDGSKEAFNKWRGNIREMHDPTKAVGRALKIEPIDDEKAIDLTLRVSKGAEDTWQKVLDGTLAGGSIGARNGVWGKRTWNGKEVPFLERYDLVEVSLVDNPSCPGCDVKLFRADGIATDVIDCTEENPEQQTTPDITRIGARVGAGTKASMHKSRDLALQGVREQLANCPCEECQSAAKVLDPDGDGDVDIVASLDTDHDGAGGDGSGIMKFVQTEITRHMAPILTRMNSVAARFAATDITNIQAPDPELTRRIGAVEQKLAGLDEVRSLLSEVKGLTEQIAAQPQPGGPIVNSAALRNISPTQQSDPLAEDAATVARLAKAGILNKNQQVEAVMYLQRLERQQIADGRR